MGRVMTSDMDTPSGTTISENLAHGHTSDTRVRLFLSLTPISPSLRSNLGQTKTDFVVSVPGINTGSFNHGS